MLDVRFFVRHWSILLTNYYMIYFMFDCTCRSQLLRHGQKRASVQERPSNVGHHGSVRFRFSHGEHGSASLRDVLRVRKRLVSHPLGSRPSVRQAVPRWAQHIGSAHTVLSHTKIHAWKFAKVFGFFYLNITGGKIKFVTVSFVVFGSGI